MPDNAKTEAPIFGEIAPELTKLFGEIFSPLRGIAAPINLRIKDNSARIELNVPGFKIEEINIELNQGKLKIQGQKKEDDSIYEDYEICEFKKSAFKNELVIKREVNPENINAKLENGILIITFPIGEENSAFKVNISDSTSQ